MADYTINDAFCDGFECGLAYMIRYADENISYPMLDEEVDELAEHLAEKKSWRSAEDWKRLIYSVYNRGGK